MQTWAKPSSLTGLAPTQPPPAHSSTGALLPVPPLSLGRLNRVLCPFHSAPEVLTGSYTTKIDIFSFGVLLVQMCTGEVPSIERRQAHIKRAVAACPDLAPLIRRCLEADASKRPTADLVVRMLEKLKLSPEYASFVSEHGGGVLIERTFRCVHDPSAC